MNKRPPPQNSQSTASVSQKWAVRAESLIEIIVTITVIGIVMTAVQSLIRISVRSELFMKNQNAASHLALDSFAALKNLRDTNYLRFASDAENCWNKLEVTEVSECSDTSTEAITEGVTYYLAHDFDDSPFGEWHLYEDDPLSDEDTFIDLYSRDGTDWSAQTGITNSDFTVEKSHIFERTLTMDYGDANGDGLNDYYDVTIVISWSDTSSTEPHSLRKTARISNIY